MSNIKFNFYEILNVSPNATTEELKIKYKQMILQCHPDKLQQQQQTLENTLKNLEIKDDPNSLEFVVLTEAWNCLKDPLKRKQYDAELLLNKFHTHNNIYAHITLKEMKKVTNTKDYYFQDDDEEDNEELKIKKSKENEKTETSKYLYTYDCRCGGQYIVDESAEQYCRSGNNHHYDGDNDTKFKNSSDKDNNGAGDDGDADHNTQNNKNSPNMKKYKNNGGAGDNDGGSSEGVVFIKDNDETPEAAAEDADDGELIVECSECSLVIVLNG